MSGMPICIFCIFLDISRLFTAIFHLAVSKFSKHGVCVTSGDTLKPILGKLELQLPNSLRVM